MKDFYFTFGCGQLLANHAIVIPAATEEKARQIMSDTFGSKWCGCYTEEQFRDGGCSGYELIVPVDVLTLP